jgi:hypothetical protein
MPVIKLKPGSIVRAAVRGSVQRVEILEIEDGTFVVRGPVHEPDNYSFREYAELKVRLIESVADPKPEIIISERCVLPERHA